MKTARVIALASLAGALVGAAAIGSWMKASVKVEPVVKTKPIVTKPKVELVADYAVPILMYHRINRLTEREAKSPLMRDLTVSPEDFEAQVAYLVSRGFTFLLASDVEAAAREGRGLPEKAVCITMDDGYRDNFDEAYPILRRYGACATVFVVTSSMGKPARLDWSLVGQMRRGGIGFASHSVTHPDLTSLPDDRLDYELRESREELERRLSEDIRSIAYPAGAFDDRVIERAEMAGYWAGWKKGGGPVMPGAQPMRLPRVRVNGSTSMEKFERKVWSGVVARAIEREKRTRVARRRVRDRVATPAS